MLEILHKLGVRIIQLTYNERNLVGDGLMNLLTLVLAILAEPLLKK